jgi:hypothetical protein
MSFVNVIFAIDQATAILLRQNFQRDDNGDRLRTDLTDSQADKLRHSIRDHWVVPNIAGVDYRVVSWYVPEIYEDPEDWTTIPEERDENGDVILTPPQAGMVHAPEHHFWHTVDDAIYSQHAQFMRIFPDVDGSPATVPAELNNVLGWAERIWITP